jgi:hypothetical protein
MIKYLKKFLAFILHICGYFKNVLTFKNLQLCFGAFQNRKFYTIINSKKIRKIIKKSDTIVIYGTGSSINKIKKNEWKKLRKFNSISLGHFAEHAYKKKINIDIVHIKEIGAWGDIVNSSQLENIKEVVNYIEGCQKLKNFNKTIFLLQSGIPGKCSNYMIDNLLFKFKTNLSFYKNSQVLNNANKFIGYKNFLNGRCGSLSMAITFVIKLGWKNIILAGVDLVDNRYFYLKNNQTPQWNNKRKIKVNDPHSMKKRTIEYINDFSKWSKSRDIKLHVLNKKNILADILPIYKFK